ncbi:MAG: SHOCT domain-containing protein [Sphingomonadales bacterium]|nr:SHOCT domain-containing protein [Sphingomonadales bacterium]
MRKMSILAPAVAGASSLLLASPLWAQETAWHGGYPGSQHMAGWYGGWVSMIFGPLLMILVPVALIVVVLLAVRGFWPSSNGSSSAQPTVPSAPLDILKERFARGEIDKEEFEERRRILKDDT